MARVLYGIHGTGHGHAMRGLTIARKLGAHEFLFVANDDAVGVLEPEFRVYRLPNLGTVFKNYTIDMGRTISKALPILWQRKKYIADLVSVIEQFQPDVCMTDLEYFVPRAAEEVGLACLTLDHQHIITCCEHDLPKDMLLGTFLQGLTPKYLFRPTDFNLIISFYAPPVRSCYKARVAPPILRDKVIESTPTDEGHVVVYQSNDTDKALIDFLCSATKRTCYVFGYPRTEGRVRNVVFQPKSEDGFLRLLAGASYVIQGGSHTLMSEALYLGKPILTLPLGSMIEQRFNALYVERLGYGCQASMHNLSQELLNDFEAHLEQYRATISQSSFLGNTLVFDLVDTFIRSGTLALN